jgi:hypothetical protein
MLASLLANWRLLALSGAALLLAGFLFYGWAYERGASACEVRVAAATLKATKDNAAANQKALGREIREASDRAKAYAELRHAVSSGENDATLDLAAPGSDQLFYDRLRGGAAQPAP